MTEASDVTLPRQFRDKYTIIGDCIGEGGFGSVYRVKEVESGQLYALKIVTYRSKYEHELIQREAAIQQTLEHRHVLPMLDFVDEPSQRTAYMLLPLCTGGDISKKITGHIRRGTYFPESEIWQILTQILSGLEYLQTPLDPVSGRFGIWDDARGVELALCHRDLKPENLLLHDGEVKIADFGLTRSMQFGETFSTQAGTVPYMAPELAKGQRYGDAVDRWAIGIIIVEMTTLKRPFRSYQVKAGLDTRNYKCPSIGSRYSKALQSVVSSLLQIDPRRRATIAELLQVYEVRLERLSIGEKNLAESVVKVAKTQAKVDQKLIELEIALGALRITKRKAPRGEADGEPDAKRYKVDQEGRKELGWALGTVRNAAQFVVDKCEGQ